jgi:nitroreductase
MSVWKTLLETAIYTPSPHNVQPWRLRIVSDESADLLIETRRTLPKEDPTGSFIILTMGLFIEALIILAANRSLKLAYQLYSPPSQFTPEHIAKAAVDLLPFARLVLGPSKETSQYDDSLFLTRRTSRTSYLSQPLPDQAIEALSNLAYAWGQTYKQVTEPETIEQILSCNIDAVFQDLSTPAYHDEIVEWFRFTDRAAHRTRDGLDYRCMNSSRMVTLDRSQSNQS